jgi:peptidylprolyl isomerase
MISKFSAIALLAALTTAATAQTTTKKPATTTIKPATTTVHHATTATAPPAAASCAKLPELSPKIPALPAGLPCAKPLYTITIEPSVKLDYISPLEGPELRQILGLESSSFSLNYIDAKIGTGELAAPHKWYTVHYTGYLVDGTKFDSSYDHPGAEPFTVAYGQHQVIPGWDTGFDGMHVGGKRRLFIPYQLAYGANGKPPRIPAKSDLIFDIELVSISDTPPVPKAPPAPPANPSAAASDKPADTPAKPTADPNAKPATDPAAKPSTAPPPADSTKPETTPHPQSL